MVHAPNVYINVSRSDEGQWGKGTVNDGMWVHEGDSNDDDYVGYVGYVDFEIDDVGSVVYVRVWVRYVMLLRRLWRVTRHRH